MRSELVQDEALEVGVAAFSTRGDRIRTVDLQSAARVRSASVVKPLLARAAVGLPPFVEHPAEWRRLARPAVTTSDNASMAALWSRAGGQLVVAALNQRIRGQWDVAAGEGEHPSLRLMVTAHELTDAYGELVLDRSGESALVQQWMREVPRIQTFGVRRIAAETLDVEESAVGTKCGWFGGHRAHAVVTVALSDRIVGAAVTTARAPDARSEEIMRDAVGDDGKLALAHDHLMGSTIRAAVARALRGAHDL